MKKSKAGSGMSFGFRPYVYRPEEQDQMVDELRTVLDDHGGKTAGHIKKIHETTGMSASTMYNLLSGKTLHPRFSTLARWAGYHGMEYRLVPAESAKARNGKTLRKRFPSVTEAERRLQ